jgi:hypothetical protein
MANIPDPATPCLSKQHEKSISGQTLGQCGSIKNNNQITDIEFCNYILHSVL